MRVLGRVDLPLALLVVFVVIGTMVSVPMFAFIGCAGKAKRARLPHPIARVEERDKGVSVCFC